MAIFKNMSGNIPGGNFPGGGDLPGGSLMAGNFPGWEFSWYRIQEYIFSFFESFYKLTLAASVI